MTRPTPRTTSARATPDAGASPVLVDEQAAKAAAQEVIRALQAAWAPFRASWRDPRSLVYQRGSGGCQVETSATVHVSRGPSDLMPGFNEAVTAYGFLAVAAVDYVNGQGVLRSTHPDGRVVEYRDRARVVTVHSPTSSPCQTSPRRI